LDRGDDVRRVRRTVSTVLLRNASVGLVLEAQIGDQDARATCGQGNCSRCTYAVVRTGDEGDVTA
jgi:hypothetical protein